MTALIKYDAACQALAACKAVDEVKSWADKAAAMQAYGRMAKDKTLEVDAAEIRIRAERRLGEMLTQQRVDGGLNRGTKVAGNEAGKGQGSPAVVTDDRRPKLADAGISKDLSARAQKLAAVPEEEFESEVGEWRQRVTAENARVTSRLEKAGERAVSGKAKLTVIQGGKDAAEVERLKHELADRTAERDELTDRLAEMSDDLAGYMKACEGNDAAALEIKRLNALLHTVERQRDDQMGKCSEMLKQIKMLERQLRRSGKGAA